MSNLEYLNNCGHFYFDLARAMYEAADQPEKKDRNRIEQLIVEKSLCLYHEHDTNDNCCTPLPRFLTEGKFRSALAQLHFIPTCLASGSL